MPVKRTKLVKEENVKYKGAQLLRMEKYRGRIARIVLKPDGAYSLEEADSAISDYLKKKG